MLHTSYLSDFSSSIILSLILEFQYYLAKQNVQRFKISNIAKKACKY